MANEQVTALARELVDYISGEPRRVEEAKAAKAKGGDSADARKARLADEVAKKIAAIMPAEEEADASASKPSSGASAQHKSP